MCIFLFFSPQCQIGLLFFPFHYFHSFRDGLGVKKSNFFSQINLFSFCARIEPKLSKFQKTVKIEKKSSKNPVSLYRQDRQWCGFSTHAAPAGYIVHACCPSYIGIFYSIRLHSARMLPLLGIYYIRLHSARMLPLLGAACVEKPHHWRSCL